MNRTLRETLCRGSCWKDWRVQTFRNVYSGRKTFVWLIFYLWTWEDVHWPCRFGSRNWQVQVVTNLRLEAYEFSSKEVVPLKCDHKQFREIGICKSVWRIQFLIRVGRIWKNLASINRKQKKNSSGMVYPSGWKTGGRSCESTTKVYEHLSEMPHIKGHGT